MPNISPNTTSGDGRRLTMNPYRMKRSLEGAFPVILNRSKGDIIDQVEISSMHDHLPFSIVVSSSMTKTEDPLGSPLNMRPDCIGHD